VPRPSKSLSKSLSGSRTYGLGARDTDEYEEGQVLRCPP
jgi:hypothetical protein